MTRRTLAPWLAPLLALCVLVTAFAKVEHEAAFRHVRCAEHGELTHVPGTSAASVAGATPVEADARHDGTREGSDPVRVEHEHCALSFAAAEAVIHTFVATAIPFAPPLPPQPFSRPCLEGTDRDVRLACAPKTSPPC